MIPHRFRDFTNAELKAHAQRLTTQLVRADGLRLDELYEEIGELREEMLRRLPEDGEWPRLRAV